MDNPSFNQIHTDIVNNELVAPVTVALPGVQRPRSRQWLCRSLSVNYFTLPLSKCWILRYVMWYDCHARDHKHIKHYNFGIFEVFRHFSHTINTSVAVGEIQKYFQNIVCMSMSLVS